MAGSILNRSALIDFSSTPGDGLDFDSMSKLIKAANEGDSDALKLAKDILEKGVMSPAESPSYELSDVEDYFAFFSGQNTDKDENTSGAKMKDDKS